MRAGILHQRGLLATVIAWREKSKLTRENKTKESRQRVGE